MSNSKQLLNNRTGPATRAKNRPGVSEGSAPNSDKQTKRVNASTEIPVGMPYNVVFRERIPLLQAARFIFSYGKANYGSMYDSEGCFHVAEAGTYRGRGLKALVLIARELGIRIQFTGLDSFQGLPELSDKDVELAPENIRYLREQMFDDVTVAEVEGFLKDANDGNINLIKGFFADTLPQLPERKYLMVVIDCDLYQGHLETLEYFYPRMLQGGMIFFDDYFSPEFPQAGAAIDAFFADKPEEPFHMRYGLAPKNGMKAFVIKA